MGNQTRLQTFKGGGGGGGSAAPLTISLDLPLHSICNQFIILGKGNNLDPPTLLRATFSHLLFI